MNFRNSACFMRSNSVSNASSPRQSLELDAESIEFIRALPPNQKSKTLHVVGADVRSKSLTKYFKKSIDFWQRYGILIEFLNCSENCLEHRQIWALADLERVVLRAESLLVKPTCQSHFLLFLTRFVDPQISGLAITQLRCRPSVTIFTSRLNTPPQLPFLLNHEIGHLVGLSHSSNCHCLMWPRSEYYG